MQRPSGIIPDTPGSYQFRDAQGRVIYVGKANNLRSRVSSYFADPTTLHPRTASMMSFADKLEWIEVRNEVEALLLEYALIKEHKPRFNIRLQDDKSFPFMAITTDEEWPRAMMFRGKRRKGVRYFGPYVHPGAIRDTLELLLRTFPVRTCATSKFKQHERLGRPCLLFHIEKCCGPCVGEVSQEQYKRHVDGLMKFLDGDNSEIVRKMEHEMIEASQATDFERAAKIRDRLTAIHQVLENQQMVGVQEDDMDVIGISQDEITASVQIFFVRKGRVIGRNGFVLDKVEDASQELLLDRILENIYGDEPALGIPKHVLVPVLPESVGAIEKWLSDTRGTQVSVRVPMRGDKKELQETVTLNATRELGRHRLKRSADQHSRTLALNDLQRLLQLSQFPLRIECYDMAHLHGTDYVGSMVVLEDGLPAKSEYRRFKIKDVPGNDDYAAMREVLMRRLSAYKKDRDLPVSERGRTPGKFAYPPQLLLVDGGKGQLGVAVDVVRELGLEHEIPVASLAKRLEEVFIPGLSNPIDVPRGSEALFMLQVIRDEAHRFANSFHRQLRGKRMKVSGLDGIAGLGAARKEKLMQVFGSVQSLQKVSIEELRSQSGLPEVVVQAVFDALHQS
ncbi:MAG: excinuclease ABC subunit UvrC [Actinobacteria bacterium]|nr:MAG: excinuclease ABC subunit UvrC [Actinomycetota bacterium]